MFRISFLILVLIANNTLLTAQKIHLINSGAKTSIRGLSVVNDKIIWASGSNGMVGKTADGGRTWQWITVKGFEKRDFRDIEAFDAQTAIIMAIAEPANILKTTDGGKNWKMVFADSTKGMFLDAMDFFDNKIGTVVGDPINGQLFLAYTNDAGETWSTNDSKSKGYNLSEGEAFFAASGTNITVIWDSVVKMADVIMVTGGKQSRLFINDESKKISIIQGKESTGANSIAFHKDAAVIVGGDFAQDTLKTNNCVILQFNLAKKDIRFLSPASPPHGYRSCVAYITQKKLITCGTSGVDISKDGGMNWRLISGEGFHVCRKAKKGKAVFLAGGNGRIARLIW